MATRKSIWVHLGILVISIWILGLLFKRSRDHLKFKSYTYVIKAESSGRDVDDTPLVLPLEELFGIENGEVRLKSLLVQVMRSKDLVHLFHTKHNFSDVLLLLSRRLVQ